LSLLVIGSPDLVIATRLDAAGHVLEPVCASDGELICTLLVMCWSLYASDGELVIG